MTIGRRERIVYRAVVESGRSGSFLPPHGVGYGLGDDLGIVLNRTIKGPTKFRAMHRVVVGVVVAEDTHHIVIEQADGRRVRIDAKEIIERTVVA